MENIIALLFLDPWLIAPYRWPGSALLGYLLGTSVLVLQCVLVGDLVMMGVAAVHRGRLSELRRDMNRHHALSEEALKRGDKESYKAVNKQGLEAFGYSFSLGGALFCVSLLPVPFALGWMHLRFAEAPIEIPFLGISLNYFASFLLLYVAIRVLYGVSMRRIPLYRRVRGYAIPGSMALTPQNR
jgi:hypothetical protein